MSSTAIAIIIILVTLIIVSLFFKSGRGFWSSFAGLIGDLLEGIGDILGAIFKIFD